jgi:hypothetical protein
MILPGDPFRTADEAESSGGVVRWVSVRPADSNGDSNVSSQPLALTPDSIRPRSDLIIRTGRPLRLSGRSVAGGAHRAPRETPHQISTASRTAHRMRAPRRSSPDRSQLAATRRRADVLHGIARCGAAGPGPHASGAPWGIDPRAGLPLVVLRGHLEALSVYPVCSCDSRIRSGGHHLAAHDGGAKAPTRLPPGW